MINKTAQTLIVSLWILVMLTLLVVSTGQRVSIALRLSRYHRDKLKASCLAKTGINRVISDLKKNNTNDYDSLDEPWAKGGEVLINEQEKVSFSAVDQERKININTASKELILALLEGYKVDSSQEITDNICIWRGDTPDDKQVFDALGYPAKAAHFSNCEELKLVKGITQEIYQKLIALISVSGDASVNGEAIINVNTATQETLTIFLRGLAKKLAIDEGLAGTLAAKINDLRIAKGPFKVKDEIKVVLTGSEETNLFNSFINSSVLRSNFFLIEAVGNVGRIKDKIEAVYDQKEDKLVYLQES